MSWLRVSFVERVLTWFGVAYCAVTKLPVSIPWHQPGKKHIYTYTYKCGLKLLACTNYKYRYATPIDYTSTLERIPKRPPVSFLILLTHLLISPILRLHSLLLHSTLD